MRIGVAADRARDQVKVEPIAVACGDRLLRYGADPSERDELSTIPGFGLSDRDLDRARYCTVFVQVQNNGDGTVRVLDYTLKAMRPDRDSGFPGRLRGESRTAGDGPGQSTDAVIDDPFVLEGRDSVQLSWQVENNPSTCQSAGVTGTSLITLRVRTHGRTLTVDPGLTFSIRNVADRLEGCRD